MHLHVFEFNPFQENTYLIWDDAGHCAIIDPGCFSANEEIRLREFVQRNSLTVVAHLLTHGHVDHVAGCGFVHKTWGAPFMAHPDGIREMHDAQGRAMSFGFSIAPGPEADRLLAHGDVVAVGSLRLEVLHTLGHSPGSVSFFERGQQTLISGDVLFEGSIGRTDLPGGNYETLMHSIFNTLLPLGDDVAVYPGHGPATTLGEEKQHNRYLRQWMRDQAANRSL